MKGCSEMSKQENVTPEQTTDVVTRAASNGSGSSALDKLSMMSSGQGVVSTISGTTLEAKKATLNAITSADPIADHLGETLNLVHCVFQAVTVVDDKTGEGNETVRTILLTDDGKAYAAISEGLMGSLRDIFGILGQPDTWPEPLPIQVVEKRGRSGYRFMKIELA